MTNELKYGQEQGHEFDNVLKAFDMVKKVAAEHEPELRDLVKREKGESFIEPINRRSLDVVALAAAFDEQARRENIDLDSFYRTAGRYDFSGLAFEKKAYLEIMHAHGSHVRAE